MKQFYFAYEPQVHKSKVVAFIHCLPGKRSEVHFQNLDLSLLPPCCPHIWNALLWYIHLHTSPSTLFPHLEYSTGTHTPAHLSISLVPTAGILYQGICTCTPLHPPCFHSWNTLLEHAHLHTSPSILFPQLEYSIRAYAPAQLIINLTFYQDNPAEGRQAFLWIPENLIVILCILHLCKTKVPRAVF